MSDTSGQMTYSDLRMLLLDLYSLQRADPEDLYQEIQSAPGYLFIDRATYQRIVFLVKITKAHRKQRMRKGRMRRRRRIARHVSH